jgi:hypothetical protein
VVEERGESEESRWSTDFDWFGGFKDISAFGSFFYDSIFHQNPVNSESPQIIQKWSPVHNDIMGEKSTAIKHTCDSFTSV